MDCKITKVDQGDEIYKRSSMGAYLGRHSFHLRKSMSTSSFLLSLSITVCVNIINFRYFDGSAVNYEERSDCFNCRI